MKIIQFNPLFGNRFFSGPSDQEKASESLYSDINKFNPTVQNRWNGYKDPFSYNQIEQKVSDAFDQSGTAIKQEYDDQIAKGKAGAAASLASRGIIGGSALTDTQGKVAADINNSKVSTLGKLGAAKSSTLADIMKYFDQLGLAKTQGATNVDLSNIGNLFNKFAARGGAISGLNDDTTFDDILAGLGAAGNVATGVAAFL